MMEIAKRDWVIFLDMLGTKESSKLSKDEYPDKIEMFETQVSNLARSLKCDVTMRVFSDSVYLQVNDFDEVLYFCQSLMVRLFAEDIYFKGAITPGSLEEKPISISETTADGHTIDIQGSAFGPSVVPVYYGQENFKGVGFIFLPGRLTRSKSFTEFSDKYLVRSAYPIANNRLNIEWQPYWDIRQSNAAFSELVPNEDADLEEFEEGVLFVESVIHAALRAERSKKDLSRYYLSMIHAIIRNSNFEEVVYRDNSWNQYPVVFQVLQRNPLLRRGLLKIKGASTLYLHMAERILSGPRADTEQPMRKSEMHEGTAHRLIAELTKSKVLGSTYAKTPDFIFSDETRQYLAKQEIGIALRKP